MNNRKRVKVKCKDCRKRWFKRLDTISTWAGRCFSCAQILIHSDPKQKEISSINGRKIMARYNNHLPNARIFTSEMVRGEKSNFWKGGITPINMKIRQSKEYKDWRVAVFARDNYTCQECGSRGVTLHADHIKPFAYYPELRLVIENGRTLCVPCHQKTPTYKKKKLLVNWHIT